MPKILTTTVFCFLFLLLLLFFLFFFTLRPFFSSEQMTYQKKTLQINGILISAELADTPEKRARGLGKREELEEGTGMLFVFDAPLKPQFWMKDMKFSIDIIWINDGVVVDMEENLPVPDHTGSSLPLFSPKYEINSVLEVPAGFIHKHNISIGDKVQFL